MNRRRFIRTGLIFVPALVLPHDIVRASAFLPTPMLNDDTYRWAYGRIPASGGTISASSIMKNDKLISDLRQFGIRSKIQRLGSYAGDFAALKAPLIKDIGASTDDVQGFTAGDYSEATGLTGGSAGEYIDTGIDFLAPAENSFHMGCYVRTGSDAATHCMGFQGTVGDSVILVSYSGTSYWDCWQFTTGRCSVADSAGTGFYIGSRTAADASHLYKNGTSIANTTGASGGSSRAGTLSLVVHAFRDFTLGPTSNTARTLSLYTVGTGLTASDVTLLTLANLRYQTSFARNV